MIAEHSDWNAVLGHELRSPISAILGYQELLEEGTLGVLPPAAADAVHRIRLAAEQLLLLVVAIERTSDSDDAEPIAARVVIDEAVSAIRFEADARGSSIDVGDSSVMLLTRRNDARRALALVLSAAIKVGPDLPLHVAAAQSEAATVTVTGARLDPVRDSADPDLPLTGAGLRLQLARAAAGLAGGSIHLDSAGTVHLTLPRAPDT